MDGRCQRSGPPDSGSPRYHCFSHYTEKTLDFVLFIMHSVFLPRGSSIPLAFIGAPMSHQMSHWDQPDTICSDNSLVAARQGQLEDHSAAMVNCRACRPVTYSVRPASRFLEKSKEFRRGICSLYCSSTICAWSVSWQPNKQPAVMSSLVPLSFLSDLVMLFCMEKCLFKTWSRFLSHACTIFVLRHHTPVHALRCLQMCAQSHHNCDWCKEVDDIYSICFLYAVSWYLSWFLHCKSTAICLLLC